MSARICSALAAAGLAMVGPWSVVEAAPRVQTGPNAEITHDGLTRVDRATMDAAWVKSDLDLSHYNKLMLVGTEMSFRAVDSTGKRYRPGTNNQTEFAISDEGRAMLREIVSDAFREELAKSTRYELANEPGPDTLVLLGTLIDVVSQAPPDDAPGRYEVYLSSVGEATLVLELRDSLTNEVLARAADRRAAETSGFPVSANAVTVWSEVRQLARSWATLLRKRLDDVTAVGEM